MATAGVRVCVEFDYDAEQPDELSIKKGDIINNVKKLDGGWWEGTLNGKTGVFPDNFVKEVENTPSVKPMVNSRNGEHHSPGESNVKNIRQKIGAVIHMGPAPKKMHSLPKKIMAVVTYAYKAEQPDELDLKEGEMVEITKQEEEGWWEGIVSGKRGVFPNNFVKVVQQDPSGGDTAVEPLKKKPLPGEPIGGMRPPIGQPADSPNKPMSQPPRPDHKPAAQKPPGPALPERSKRDDKKRYRARVLFSYHAVNDDELSLDEGQVITVLDRKLEDPGWWKGEVRGKIGVFPDNFVELIPEEKPSAPSVGQRPSPNVPPSGLREPVEGIEDGPPPPIGPRLGHKPALGKPALDPPVNTAAPSKPEPIPVTTSIQQNHVSSRPPVAMAPAAPVNPEIEIQLRKDIEQLKMNTVSKEKHQQLERELQELRTKMDAQKKESKQQIVDMMKEVDRANKQHSSMQVEIERIRKLAETHFVNKE